MTFLILARSKESVSAYKEKTAHVTRSFVKCMKKLPGLITLLLLTLNAKLVISTVPLKYKEGEKKGSNIILL